MARPERAAIPCDAIFFGRAKVTVRAKGVRVNSVFLVQLRKKVGASLAVHGKLSTADGEGLNHRGHRGHRENPGGLRNN